MSWVSAMPRLSSRVATVAGLEAAPRLEEALAQIVARVIEQAVRLGRCFPQRLGLVELEPLLAERGNPLARRHVGDVGLDARGRAPRPRSAPRGGRRDPLARP